MTENPYEQLHTSPEGKNYYKPRMYGVCWNEGYNQAIEDVYQIIRLSFPPAEVEENIEALRKKVSE